jgi:TP901 family phage tail tape measure protein
MSLAQTYKKQGMDMSTAMKKAYSEIDKSQYETAENSKKDSKKFADNWDDAGEKVSGIAKKIGDGLKTAAKIGTAAVTAVGSGMAALGTYAAKVGGDFEAQMSKVSAISGATGDDLQALEDKAKQLGIDTKFSATDAGQAFEYMAMAGWKTEQMLDGVSGIMDLAAASGEDLASVSDIVTDAMTAFGLSAEQSTHFADVLAKASSNANTNVGLMGETFKYVAPVAGAMGFSVEDTATAIGLMANAGIKGSQAGTALRSMFSRLAKPTDEVETAMTKLGLSITNSDGSMRELDEIMADLRKGFDGLTEAEQTQIAAQLAGQEAMSGLLAIVNTSEAEFNKLANAVNNADGAAKDMAATMANNLQGKLTLLKSSAEGFGLALYDKIQTPLTEMASWAVDSLNQLTTAFNENGVDGVVEAAGNVLSEAITTVVDKLPEFVDLAVSVIESFVNGLSENQETIANGAISIITTLATGLLNMLPEIVKLGLDLIVSLANGIAASLPTLIPTIIDVILQIVDTLTSPEQLTNLLNAALVLVTELAFGLTDAIPQLFNAINQIVMNIGWFLTDPKNIAMILDAALKIIVALGTGVLNAIPVFLKNMVTFYSKIFENFKNVDWGELGRNLVDGFKNGISRAWTSLKKWFKNLFGDLIGIAKKLLGIASPSKVFKKLGSFTADGFGIGFKDEFAHVKDDMEDALDFEDASVGINASIRRVGAGAAGGAFGGTSIGNITINIDGAKYSDEQSLAQAVAEAIQSMTDRRAAVYA